MDLSRRRRLRYQQQAARNKQQLRRSLQDRKTEKLTGVPGLTFNAFVSEIQKDQKLTYDAARRRAHSMLGELGILTRLELREEQTQWRMKLVQF